MSKLCQARFVRTIYSKAIAREGSNEMSTTDITNDPAGATQDSFSFGRSEFLILILVLVFYTLTRVVSITEFPIYFFCDEATHANLALELLDNDFRDHDGNLMPPYFLNDRVYNLGLSVWVHALPVALFGTSIAVTRLTSVLIGVLGAAALMLALKIGFRSRLWWTAGLVLAALPGWFLHSRTAFETAMMVGFYAAFLLSYLLYRQVSPRWLPLAIVFGGATFYAYSNGQGVMFISILLLLITDWRYHWRVLRDHRAVVAVALITAVLVAAPYVRFRFILHPEMVEKHLSDLRSYWIEDRPVSAKLTTFAKTYAEGVSPKYWFFEDPGELTRHRMSGYGHLPTWSAPLVLLGLGICLWRARRSAPHRLVLIAVLAAPFSASLVDIRITRVLAMMAPATILAVLGLDYIRHWLRRWIPIRVFAAGAAAGLVWVSAAMTADAITHGPIWFENYGMDGLQWGTKELYGELLQRLETDHKNRYVISHTWANLPNAFNTFFLDESMQRRVRMGVIDDYLFDHRPEEMTPDTIFVLTGAEHLKAVNHPVIEVDDPIHVIPYPNGKPGFVFARIRYSSSAAAFFEEVRRERRKPVESTIELDGVTTTISHPQFDDGSIESIFDGDLSSIARTLDADPCVMVFRFAEARPVDGVRVTVWTPAYILGLRAETADGTVIEATETIDSHQSHTTWELRLPSPIPEATTVTLTIDKRGDTKAHIQEIRILP